MFGMHGRRGCGPREFHAMWSRHGRGPGHSGGGGEGGRRRLFGGDELRLVLLKLIEEQPRHGYDLIREIEARTGGAYAPSPGVVYPTLTLLADMGLTDETQGAGAVGAGSGGARKLFAITEAGRAVLAEKAAEVTALFARLAEIGAVRARTDAAPVRRAMGNLRAALQDRLSADDVTPDIQHAVAALLDEVTQKIERL